MDYDALGDEELVALSHSGDRDAENTLCVRYKSTVEIKARPYFLMGADTVDLVQEGMIGLFKAIRDYEPDHGAQFRSFAEICITRQMITAVKTASRKKHAPLNTYVSLFKAAYDDEGGDKGIIDMLDGMHAENPEDMLISKESLESISELLKSKLSPLEKQSIELFLQGCSYAEIAQRLNRSTKAVDNALQRVKKKLESYLNASD